MSSAPALYLDLLEDLSPYLSADQLAILIARKSCDWYVDSTPKQVAAVALASSFMKKFIDGSDDAADAACLDKFVKCNAQCESWSMKLGGSWDELLLGEFKNLVYRFFYPGPAGPLISTFPQILDRGRVGPGASVGASGDDFYTKLFSSKLSTTSLVLYDIYSRHMEHDPLWQDAEIKRQAVYGEVSVCGGNRLSYVPKNVDTSRSICTEPSLNMFFQLGIGSILEKRLGQFFGIDLTTQPDRNRELARIGSFDQKEGGLCTIDLSSASDTISLKMLRECVPAQVLGWFLLTRSPISELPNGAKLALNMMSTMGNGFTFPLQTMIFACVVTAVYKVLNIPIKRWKGLEPGNFGVFGDDIICVREAYACVCRLLTLLGFEVNSSKSFSEGPFRESCGCDYFRGHNVRGVYCKTLKTVQARFAVINQLNLWSARCGIPLCRTIGHLIRTVPRYYVPVWENDDAGIRVPEKHLQRKRYTKLGSYAYRKYVPRNKRLTIKDGFIHVPKGSKPRIYNASGLLIAFLRGDIEQAYITVRQRTVLYTTRIGVAPSWDCTPTGPALPAGVNLSNFGWAVAVNDCQNP